MKLPKQAAPILRTISTASTEKNAQSNGVFPSIIAPTECLMGGNSPLCQTWRSGHIIF